MNDSSDYDDGASLFRTHDFLSPKDTLPVWKVSKIDTSVESYDSGDSSEDDDWVIHATEKDKGTLLININTQGNEPSVDDLNDDEDDIVTTTQTFLSPEGNHSGTEKIQDTEKRDTQLTPPADKIQTQDMSDKQSGSEWDQWALEMLKEN